MGEEIRKFDERIAKFKKQKAEFEGERGSLRLMMLSYRGNCGKE